MLAACVPTFSGFGRQWLKAYDFVAWEIPTLKISVGSWFLFGFFYVLFCGSSSSDKIPSYHFLTFRELT